ncbi:carboxypeptidase regulatory-like domain-containing protein, partial [bacterium]|nr:carboxypeptidase regulatory-like domain-containing protein [bacterium]
MNPANGSFAIVQYDVSNGDLQLSQGNIGAWDTETIDSQGDVGQYPAIGFQSDGIAHVVYRDVSNTGVKYAGPVREPWIVYFDVVDSAADVGAYVSAAVRPGGFLALAYYDSIATSLKFSENDGSGWTASVVDDAGDVGSFASLEIGPKDEDYIVYADRTLGATKLAYRSKPGPASGRVSGVVKSINGSPISEAEVSAEGRNSTTSSSDGTFQLENLPPGQGYRIAARAVGHAPGLVEGVSVSAGRTTIVDFNLSPVSENYQVSALQPSAGAVSSVYEGGMAIRYYRVRTTSGTTPQATAGVGWEVRKNGNVVQTGTTNTNVDGEAMVWANTKGIATAGEQLTGTVVSLNGTPIASGQRPTFTVHVLPAPFEVSYRQRVNGELQGSILGRARVGGEAGFDLTYPCTSSSGSTAATMEVSRKKAMRAAVGVDSTLFEVGAEYEANNFTLGADIGVGAGADVLGVKKHSNRYEFDSLSIMSSNPDWNKSAAAFIALNDTFGLASGHEVGMDAAMLYILSWVEQRALNQGGPLTALNEAYGFSESGYGVAAEVGAQARLLAGAAGQTQGTITVGLNANAALRGKAEATVDFGYDPKELLFQAGNTLRVDGSLSTAIGAGAQYGGAIGRPRQSGIPNLVLLPKQNSHRDDFGWTLASAAWTGGAGLEYRYRVIYSGTEKRIDRVVFEVAPFQRVNFQSNLRRFVYTAQASDSQV